jgi:hypothetical protein
MDPFEIIEKAILDEKQEIAPETPEIKEVVTTEEKPIEEIKEQPTLEETEKKEVAEEKKEPEPTPNPLDELPEEVKEYAQAKKQNPDLKFDEFIKEKNFDINSLSVLDIAREKAIKEGLGKITKENVDAFLEKKTGIILTEEGVELDEFDELDLEKFIGDFRDNFKKEIPKNTPAEIEDEIIELNNGYKVSKKVHEETIKLQESQRLAYEEKINKAVADSKSFNLQLEFDNNGTKESINLDYDFSESEKQEMLAIAKDPIQAIDSLFRDEKNEFNHADFVKALMLMKKGPDIIKGLVNKAVANRTEALLKQEYNPNFGSNHFNQNGNPNQTNKPVENYRPPGTLQFDVI